MEEFLGTGIDFLSRETAWSDVGTWSFIRSTAHAFASPSPSPSPSLTRRPPPPPPPRRPAAHLAEEDLEFPHVVVEPGVIDGYEPVEWGARVEGRRRLLCFFLHRHLSFRLAEFQGVAEIAYGRTTWDDGLPVALWERPIDDMTRGALWYVHLPDDDDGLALGKAEVRLRTLAGSISLSTRWTIPFTPPRSLVHQSAGDCRKLLSAQGADRPVGRRALAAPAAGAAGGVRRGREGEIFGSLVEDSSRIVGRAHVAGAVRGHGRGAGDDAARV